MQKKFIIIWLLIAQKISADNLLDDNQMLPLNIKEMVVENQSSATPIAIELLPEQAVEYALLQKDYEFLAKYLPIYRQSNHHDAVLADFAEAAMLRQQFYPHDALVFYEKILSARPDYDFVRLAYAQALFEDRQYSAANTQFSQLDKSKLSEVTQNMVANYQQKIAEFYRTQYSIEANIERNNNVNNAGKESHIFIQGLSLKKDENSLPKSDTGLDYHLQMQRLFPILGPHHFQLGAGLSGTQYRKNAFNEQEVELSAAYRYQTLRHQWQLKPFVEKTWFDSKEYKQAFGISSQYQYRFHPNWQAKLGASLSHHEYENIEDLDGNHYQIDAMLLKQLPHYYLYAGLALNRKHTASEKERETQKSFFTGGEYVFDKTIGLQADWQMISREFDEANTFYAEARKDREYRARLGIFSPQFSWQGITPVLNYQYSKTDSNLSDLYDKTNQRVYFSIYKNF